MHVFTTGIKLLLGSQYLLESFTFTVCIDFTGVSERSIVCKIQTLRV